MSLFSIGFSELLVVLLIAFVVVGPQDLPKVARWLGRIVRQCRSLIAQVKAESGWNELEREINDTKADIDKDIRSLKKETDISQDIHDSIGDIRKDIEGGI